MNNIVEILCTSPFNVDILRQANQALTITTQWYMMLNGTATMTEYEV